MRAVVDRVEDGVAGIIFENGGGGGRGHGAAPGVARGHRERRGRRRRPHRAAALADRGAPLAMPPAAHVYLLLGEEDLLVDQALAELLDRLLPPEERDLNLDVVGADEIESGELITLVDTLPFFGQRRAVG